VATVHVKNGYFNHAQGYEYNLLLAAVALSVTIMGSGPLSLDAALGFHDAGPLWGFGALLAGIIGGAVQLAGRRAPQPQKAG